ncbi:tetratricopeptide repeat protein [Fontisphaera persica]|uniref:tetratricopeptide repeat protein n=1 Tax=Fontisphaera persica TaxID=2974023 RepID=UPI0024C08B31|nr:tetratricopeptide repeat protein [Fontisphaera persica]WCJ59108.1 tetratricopeptide repeat protein [Fontisphaera persica]
MMVTTKKRGEKNGTPWLGWVLALALTAGCSPPGVKDLLEGDRLLREGQYHEAIKPLQKATALMPHHALAWNHLGFAQHHAGLPDGAETAYRKALTLNPSLAAARWNLGCLCLELGRPADAAQHFGSVALLDTKNPDYQLMHAIALVRAGKADEAERLFKNLLAARGAQIEAMNGLAIAQWMRNRPQEAAATLQNVLQIAPQHRPATLNLAILNHAHLGNKPLALKLYQRYLSFTPEPPFRAQVAQVAARLEAELQVPSFPAPAMTNAATPPLPPAVTSAPPAVVLPPPAPRTNVMAAATNAAPPAAQSRTNRPAPVEPPAVSGRAATAAPQAQVLTPSPASETAAPPPPGAARRYTYLRPPKPQAGDRAQAMTHYQAGEAARAAQRWGEAQKHYEAAIKADPSFYEAHAMLGRVALENRDWPRALSAYEQALVIQPEAAGTRFNFALALHQAGFAADAVAEFERFYEAQPQETNGRMFVANIYLQELHDVPKARAHYQRLLELQPNHPQAAALREWLRQHP